MSEARLQKFRTPDRDVAQFFLGAMSSKLFSVLLLCALAGCKREQTAGPAPPPPEVAVVTLSTETVTLTRELAGRSNPFLVAEVRPQVTGIVQRRMFTEGGMVDAAQPLYQLDDSTYRADFNRAKAALARTEATVQLARLNAARTANLAKVEAVSREENETAVAALAQAEADVGVAKAALAGAEVVLGYTTIRSPIKGRIGRSSVTAGALVTANQAAALATVQQLDPIYVDLNQSSRELLELRRDFAAGTLNRPNEVPVTILLEDGTRYPHEGKLAFAEVTVDPTTGSVALRVVVPNPEQILLPGTYVRAIVVTGVREKAILVPQPGIARDPKGNATAMVVNAEGKAESRVVNVSRTIGNKWLVEKGLAAGDRVIVEGLQRIRPGAVVRIAGANSPAAPAPGGKAAPANKEASK
jgi:membrane fusion protein, multidrug efflux system